MNKKDILLVEDDLLLADLIKDFLTKYEFNVSIVSDGYEAVTQIIEKQPCLVVLDLMLPGQSGMEVCRQVRSQYDGIILMQTALDDDIDQMMGLELGADDYVIKQVQPRLLLSRIRALLRRIEHKPKNINETVINIDEQAKLITLDNLSINIGLRKVTLANEEVLLTTAEFELLYLLARTPGEPVSRDMMAKQLKGYEYDGLDRSLDKRISRLRKKLMDDMENPQIIKTIRGKGYQLCKQNRE
ncbi:winged helix-turn-helix domain-containing protein [Colwellia sp. E150_009]|jgi:two-component system OmpR family response regulator/two-component system response regulator RstA